MGIMASVCARMVEFAGPSSGFRIVAGRTQWVKAPTPLEERLDPRRLRPARPGRPCPGTASGRGADGGGDPSLRRAGDPQALSVGALLPRCPGSGGDAALDPGHRHPTGVGDGPHLN